MLPTKKVFFTYRNTFFQMTRGSLYLLLSNAISELSTTTLFTCRPAFTRKRVFIISEIKRKAKESLGSEKSGKANVFKFRFPPVNASECVLSLMRFVAAGCRHDAAAAKLILTRTAFAPFSSLSETWKAG